MVQLKLWCLFFPFSCIRMVSSVVEQLRGNFRTASEIDWHSFPTKWKEPLTFMDLEIDYTSMSQSNHCSNTCVGTGTSLVCLVAQLCPTLCDPMDCSPPASSVHGIFQARKSWSGLPFPPPEDLLTQGPNPGLPHGRLDALPPEPPGKSSNT